MIVKRDISARVKDLAGEEDLVEFTTTGADIEAKSGDLLCFSLYEDQLIVLTNLTVASRIQFLEFPITAVIARLRLEAIRPRAHAGILTWALCFFLGNKLSQWFQSKTDPDLENTMLFVCVFASLVPALIVTWKTPRNKQKNEELQILLDYRMNAQQTDPGPPAAWAHAHPSLAQN